MSDLSPVESGPIVEARAVYLRVLGAFGDPLARRVHPKPRARRTAQDSLPFGAGRDPDKLDAIIGSLTRSMGWASPLAQSDLVSAWREIAGPETAEHSTPVAVEDGVLKIECDSTAWATQLRIMRVEITTRIAQRYPEAGVRSIQFSGPNAPSWKRGPRSVQGRGPRDTYG